MNEQIVYDILDYFVMDKHDHCLAEDKGLCCEDIADGKCMDCWLEYFKHGAWWEKEHEPDPDRKWKERRECN